jgi:hypothetical protein
MGAFKQFLSTDVTVVPFVVNKSFSFEGTASLSASGIFQYRGHNYAYNSALDISFTNGPNNGGSNIFWENQQPYNTSLIYNSVKQLYYTNYIQPSQSQTPPLVYDYNGNLLEDYTTTATNARFYNYEQTTLFQLNTGSFVSNYGYQRLFSTASGANIFTLSIPQKLFGDYINPKSFVYEADIQGGDIYKWYDSLGDGIISQDINGSLTYLSRGIINYAHGTMIISQISTGGGADYNNVTCSFQSTRTIFETQYKCTIRPDEFNYSLNPSLISGSTDGTPYNFVTGSYFAPYVTTVGLYNEKQELLAVAKLAQPLPTSRTTDTTIVINIDR